MVRYLVLQIEQRKLKYSDVVEAYPIYKEKIDDLLREHGRYEELAK